MSLVETALKKMQAARSGSEKPVGQQPHHSSPATVGGGAPVVKLAPGVIGELVQPGTHRASETVAPPTARVNDKWIRVDRQALRQEGLLAPEHQERLLGDQFRQIKRPLIATAIGRGVTKAKQGQLIMIASALAGEGKTFTSINLALSMALDKDVSVLLIDADVPKPHITRTFGITNEPGLLDVLRDEKVDVESVVVQTDVPGLSVLPTGRRSETAAELLSSHRMTHCMASLAARDPNRIILIDSPPLLLTNESRVLSHTVGQIVIVVRAGITPQQAVLDAIDYLDEDKSINFVLNQSRNSASISYYGYPDADSQPPP